VKRYAQNNTHPNWFEERDDGPWVKADDALKRVTKLEAALKEARALVRQVAQADCYGDLDEAQEDCADAVKQWDKEPGDKYGD